MSHEHHEWLADINNSIVESFKREQAAASERGRAQEVGHGVESTWLKALTQWLPPQYAMEKRKYLLLETDNGPRMTKETDLVVFHPHYPTGLRDEHHLLASGVAAAFSVKRTVGREDIVEAYEAAISLRRGMQIREDTEKAHLVPPVFYGLLGQSHDWKAENSTRRRTSVKSPLSWTENSSPRHGRGWTSSALPTSEPGRAEPSCCRRPSWTSR